MFNFIKQERIPEWITSAVLLSFGASLLLPTETLSLTGYSVLKAYGFTDYSLGTILVIVGCGRLLALGINGSWKRTPLIRLFGAAVGVLVFVALAIGFFAPILVKEAPTNTAWGTYLILAISDFFSGYKAGQHARHARDLNR